MRGGERSTRRSPDSDRPARVIRVDHLPALVDRELTTRDQTTRGLPHALHPFAPVVGANRTRDLARADRLARASCIDELEKERLDPSVDRVWTRASAALAAMPHRVPIARPLRAPRERAPAGRARLLAVDRHARVVGSEGGGVEGSTLRDDVDGVGRSTLTSRTDHTLTSPYVAAHVHVHDHDHDYDHADTTKPAGAGLRRASRSAPCFRCRRR